MQIASAQLWVQDQDEALAFWTEKIGFEVRQDVTLEEMGTFRWLTVGPHLEADLLRPEGQCLLLVLHPQLRVRDLHLILRLFRSAAMGRL